MYLVIDIETSKFPHMSPWDAESFICSVGMESSLGETWVWLLSHVTEPARPLLEAVREIQEQVDKADLLVFHNAKFDLAWLRHIGVIVNCPVWCTQVGDFILYGQNPDVNISLNGCCKRRYLPIKKDMMADFWQEGFETNEIPWGIHKDYLQQDVRITRLLYERQVPAIAKAGLTNLVKYNSQVASILSEVEYNGVKFNKDRALQLHQEYKDEAAELLLLMYEYTGFEFQPSSPKQLQTVLFGGEIKKEVKELVAKPRKDGSFRVMTRKATMLIPYSGVGITPHFRTYSDKTQAYSTGKKARALMDCHTEFARSFKRVLDKYALVNKAWSTILNADETKGWMTKIQMDGKLHPTFNNCFVRTGRLSSSDPNGQNLPRYGAIKLKDIFVPEFDYIVSCDLSQIEWRMAAALSEDKTMCREIIDGLDCHTENGEKFFGGDRHHPEFKKKVRQPCKTFNFRMIYGGGPAAYAYDPEMPKKSLDEWKGIVNGFKEKYKTLTSWQRKNLKQVESKKYIKNKTGRILTFHYNTDPSEGIVGYSPTDVCNYPVQSASADLLYIALLEMHRFMKDNGYKSKIILLVHDSFVFDCPRNEAYIIAKRCLEIMKDLPNLSEKYYGWKPCVPTEGEATVGRNYGESFIEVKLEDVEKIKEAIANDSKV